MRGEIYKVKKQNYFNTFSKTKYDRAFQSETPDHNIKVSKLKNNRFEAGIKCINGGRFRKKQSIVFHLLGYIR